MSSLRLGRISLLVLGVLGATTGSVRAQTDDDKATAQTLFDDGMRLYNAGNFADACPKFAASLKHYSGLGTRGKLAECYEKVGRIASAWASWREVAVLAHQQNDSKREQIAGDRVKSLEPRLSHLTIVVDTSATVANLTVTRNGAPVEAAVLGTAIAVDPDAQHIEASAPGHVAWSTDVTVGEKESKTVTVPVLVVAPRLVVTPPPGGADESPPPVNHRGRRIAGIVTVGVGAASMILGGVFGIEAKSSWDDAFAAGGGCAKQTDGTNLCTGPGQDKANTARHDANLANIFVGAGAAVVVTGVVLWVISPNVSEQSSSSAAAFRFAPTITPNQVGASLSGSF